MNHNGNDNITAFIIVDLFGKKDLLTVYCSWQIDLDRYVQCQSNTPDLKMCERSAAQKIIFIIIIIIIIMQRQPLPLSVK